MGFNFKQDLDFIFQDAGEEVLVGPEYEEEIILGFFGNAHQSFGGGQFVEVSSSQPILIVQNKDVAEYGITTGTRVVVEEEGEEVAYFVRDPQPDGNGCTYLQLRKAPPT
jgi:hypothetical protein